MLAISVFAVLGALGWAAAKESSRIERAERAVKLAARVANLEASLALERGLALLALGRLPREDAAVLARLSDVRRASDQEFEDTLSEAQSPTNGAAPGIGLTAALEIARGSRREQLALRAAHAGVRDGPAGVRGGPFDAVEALSYFRAATSTIEDLRAVRGELFSVGAVSETRLAAVAAAALAIGEYAGRERALVGFHIAAGRPIPKAVADELEVSGRLASVSELFLRRQLLRRDVEAGEWRTLTDLLDSHVDRFAAGRALVQEGAATGIYALDATDWLDASTASIERVLAVSRLSADGLKAAARAAAESSRRSLVLVAALALATLLLLFVSLRSLARANARLVREKELAEVTLHSIGDAVITTDLAGRVDNLNPIAETLTGWSSADARGRPLDEVFVILSGLTRAVQTSPVARCLRENAIVGLENNTVLIARDGTERTIEDSAAPVRDRSGKVIGAVLVFYDVTLLRSSPHLLSHHASHDALTGLLNRREFDRRLVDLVSGARESKATHALLYMDLDQFKIVNDTCGHVAGDKLLRQLAFVLGRHVRDADTLARLGGDEFGVLLVSCAPDPALSVAHKLARAINEFRFVWDGTTFEVGVSIGVVSIDASCPSAGAALSEADAACYAAKDAGRNRVHFYRADDAELKRKREFMHWVPRIRSALQQNRFRLDRQRIAPLWESGPAQERCYELLVRMLDEDGTVIAPMAFIPAAERYDLMTAVDRWVIGAALDALQAAAAANATPPLRFFINLSGASLGDPGVLEHIRDGVARTGVDPRRLCFEITETAAIANLEVASGFMRELSELGCTFALDDFGSGMSSFSYLKNLPVEFLKIDGSFITQLTESATDHAMVDAIQRVARAMGIRTIAEFVENDDLIRQLREIGVDYVQGYGIERPAPLDVAALCAPDPAQTDASPAVAARPDLAAG